MKKQFEKFVVAQKVVLIRNNKCLILERADKPGLWELPGGRIDQGENDRESFKREIKEEIGLKKFEIIGPVDYYVWLNTPAGAHACGITNLIKNDRDEIRLSSENINLAWITEAEINNYKYFWPKSERAIKKGFAYYKLIKGD
jgi:8-oxo-dGTP pyrophosphatase MutT (NUDIX family)